MNQLLALTIIVISLLLPAATAIKCYQCEPDESERCAKPSNITTCESMYDSCMITSITMKIPNVGEVTNNGMNCGVKAQCQVAEEAVCKGANSTGMVTKCTVKCCSEDLCNYVTPTTPPTAAAPTSTGERAVGHFGAIFATAVLSLQALSLAIN